MKAISIHNLFFEYEGGVKALQDISVEVEEGELLAVMGPNGAGKSTLCYLLSGIIPNIYGGRRRGEVYIYDFDPWDRPIYETSQVVGIVLQDPETQLLMPNIWMELAFGPASLGVPRDEIEKRVKDALKIVGLEGFEKRHPDELSGGQKQRVAIAATLTMNPKILILDEPTSQLDPIGTYEVLNALKKLKESRKLTIVLTTHKSDEAAPLADKILVLNNGRIVAYGKPDEILSKPEMLDKVGVKPPTIPTVFRKLGINEYTMDLNTAVNLMRKIFERGGIKIRPSKISRRTYRKASDPIISIRNVSYTYPGPPPVKALDNINLDIYEGEFIGIIGQNGSGKTTLVKNIVGLLRPQKGAIYFRGEDIRKYTVGELSRRIGLVLQNPDYQLFTISCLEEVKFGLRNIGLSDKEAEEKALKALEMVGLSNLKDAFPFRLSFGDRRKLAVAAVVAMEPEVLILDEPTTAQDYRGRYLLADIAKKLNEEMGVTVIMISHDMELIARYAERVIVMKDGRILLDGPTEEVFLKRDVLAEAFIKPPIITELSIELREFGMPTLLTVDELDNIIAKVS